MNKPARRRYDPESLPGTGLQLPLWPQELRGLPWATLRGALFAPVKPGNRASMQRKKIATVGNLEIVYTGLQLDQADLDVYEQVLHLARRTPLGEPVRFKTREMLRSIGRAEGKSGRDWLLKSLSRLSANEIDVSNGRSSYAGSLIQEQGRDDEAGMHFIILNPRLTTLYEQGWTPLRDSERKALGRHQLAKWLHAFIQGQRKPLTFQVANLMALADSKQKRERDFRKAVDDAVIHVNEAGVDVVVLWDMRRHQVTITRSSWKR